MKRKFPENKIFPLINYVQYSEDIPGSKCRVQCIFFYETAFPIELSRRK